MLKIGQKVKTIPNPFAAELMCFMPSEGNKIGRIIGIRDPSEATDPENPAIYILDCSDYYWVRSELKPIDDTPCDPEFFEEFLETIYEEEMV